MSQPAALVASSLGIVTVAGRDFPVAVPTAADILTIQRELERQAQKHCIHPLASIAAVPPDQITPAVLEAATRIALSMTAGGGVRPSLDIVQRQYNETEGVRYRLWFAAKKIDPALARDDVERLVSDDNRDEVCAAIEVALGYAAAVPKARRASGGESSTPSTGPNS